MKGISVPRFYIDADNDKWVTGVGLRDLLPRAEFKRSPSVDVEIQFFKQGLPYELAEDEMPAVGEIGIKAIGDFDGALLVHASEWVKKGEGTSTYYLLNPAFNGPTLNGLLGHDMTPGNDEASVDCMAEIRWFENGKVHKTQTVPTTIFNDVIKGSEGTPGESAEPENYYTEGETDALLADKVDKVAGKGLSANDFTNEEKARLADAIGKMIDLESAPVATPVAVTIDGTNFPEVRVRLLRSAGGGSYQDTGGRDAFTLDGTFVDGNFYDPYLSFDAIGGIWRLDASVVPEESGSVGEVTTFWRAAVSDENIQNINAWPWEDADLAMDLGLPTFTVEFETEVPGEPGQHYRVPIEDGRYERYEKQPDNSFLFLGIYDARGRKLEAADISDFNAAVGDVAVMLTGNQVKSGTLTFASSPRSTGTPASDNDILNRKQVDLRFLRASRPLDTYQFRDRVDYFIRGSTSSGDIGEWGWTSSVGAGGSLTYGYVCAFATGRTVLLSTGATSGTTVEVRKSLGSTMERASILTMFLAMETIAQAATSPLTDAAVWFGWDNGSFGRYVMAGWDTSVSPNFFVKVRGSYDASETSIDTGIPVASMAPPFWPAQITLDVIGSYVNHNVFGNTEEHRIRLLTSVDSIDMQERYTVSVPASQIDGSNVFCRITNRTAANKLINLTAVEVAHASGATAGQH